MQTTWMKRTAGAAAVWLMAANVHAYYATIVVDGNFDDWDGVPVVANDVSGDHADGPDLATLQIANDETNLYLRITYHEEINPNAGPSVHVALDNDVDTGTGYDVFGLGLVGSEAGWQNDFPFAQANGVFNSGLIIGGDAAIAPYFAETTSQEYAIRLDATFESDASPVFPNNTFRILIYTDPTAANETMGPVTYTLSARIEEAVFEAITLVDVVAFVVSNSQESVTYRLEFSDTPETTNWVFSGYQALGNGDDLFLYDATGHTTTKVYRILSQE